MQIQIPKTQAARASRPRRWCLPFWQNRSTSEHLWKLTVMGWWHLSYSGYDTQNLSNTQNDSMKMFQNSQTCVICVCQIEVWHEWEKLLFISTGKFSTHGCSKCSGCGFGKVPLGFINVFVDVYDPCGGASGSLVYAVHCLWWRWLQVTCIQAMVVECPLLLVACLWCLWQAKELEYSASVDCILPVLAILYTQPHFFWNLDLQQIL